MRWGSGGGGGEPGGAARTAEVLGVLGVGGPMWRTFGAAEASSRGVGGGAGGGGPGGGVQALWATSKLAGMDASRRSMRRVSMSGMTVAESATRAGIVAGSAPRWRGHGPGGGPVVALAPSRSDRLSAHQLDHRLEAVGEGAEQVGGERGEPGQLGGGVEPLVADPTPDQDPVLLLDVGVVVIVPGPGTGQGHPGPLPVPQPVRVEELAAVVGVDAEQRDRPLRADLLQGGHDAALPLAHHRQPLDPPAREVGGAQGPAPVPGRHLAAGETRSISRYPGTSSTCHWPTTMGICRRSRSPGLVWALRRATRPRRRSSRVRSTGATLTVASCRRDSGCRGSGHGVPRSGPGREGRAGAAWHTRQSVASQHTGTAAGNSSP